MQPMLYIDLRQMQLPVYLYYIRWKLAHLEDIFMKILIFSQNFKDLNQIEFKFHRIVNSK